MKNCDVTNGEISNPAFHKAGKLKTNILSCVTFKVYIQLAVCIYCRITSYMCKYQGCSYFPFHDCFKT